MKDASTVVLTVEEKIVNRIGLLCIAFCVPTRTNGLQSNAASLEHVLRRVYLFNL